MIIFFKKSDLPNLIIYQPKRQHGSITTYLLTTQVNKKTKNELCVDDISRMTITLSQHNRWLFHWRHRRRNRYTVSVTLFLVNLMINDHYYHLSDFITLKTILTKGDILMNIYALTTKHLTVSLRNGSPRDSPCHGTTNETDTKYLQLSLSLILTINDHYYHLSDLHHSKNYSNERRYSNEYLYTNN